MTTNIKSLTKTVTYTIVGLIAGMFLMIGVQGAIAAWSGPKGAPPTNNVTGPVTISTDAQYKEGPLGINTTVVPSAGYGLNVSGNVAVGGKIYSLSTLDSDPGSTLVTKDYLSSVGVGGGWEDVPLTDTDNFDPVCQYRVKWGESFGTVDGEYRSYASVVNVNYLLFDVSTAEFAFGRTDYNNKSKTYHTEDGDVDDIDVNRCSTILCKTWDLTKMEKNCGGGGSGGDNLGNHTATENIDMNSSQVTDLGTPVNGSDAATKSYVDQKMFSGITTTGFFNGQSHSVDVTVTFPKVCTNPVVIVHPGEGASSIACDDGASKVGICANGKTSASQDLNADVFSITDTGFKTHLSGESGVCVGVPGTIGLPCGAVSPAYKINWIATCH